ncbi:MAG: GCN5-related N-acetyltransferase [Fluviicola sp.]|jgi:ribosomal-protein-alanine N-acetyltransferase|uniref:GNAT family N-acetyltransferase n=1 Tax=Fluviicola sp. TaxID=1917219 RepID=UPI002613B405|nr:GNAT family protein [Fluviicola sp.]MDF3026049.1 GCN5-related N-acetyltransferase [Fluviicola sp.]
MNFKQIETSRLILKGLSPEDMKTVFENYPKEKIKQILGHRSEEDYLKEENKYRNGYASYNRSFILFLLTDKASGTIIGRCGLHNWNTDHSRAEIGYSMEDESYKRLGLMSEAVEAIINYGFTQLNLNRIEALVAPNNIPSLRLIEKNNFTREGLLRKHYNVSGVFEDSVMFSKLYEEHVNEK